MKRLLLPVLAALLVERRRRRGRSAAFPPPASAPPLPACLSDRRPGRRVRAEGLRPVADVHERLQPEVLGQGLQPGEDAPTATSPSPSPARCSGTTTTPSPATASCPTGTVIKVYEASNKQMYEQPIEKSQYPAALSFLTGTGKLGDSFDFEVEDRRRDEVPRGPRPHRHAQAADAGVLQGPLLRRPGHVAGPPRDDHRRPGQPEPLRLRRRRRSTCPRRRSSSSTRRRPVRRSSTREARLAAELAPCPHCGAAARMEPSVALRWRCGVCGGPLVPTEGTHRPLERRAGEPGACAAARGRWRSAGPRRRSSSERSA